MNRLTRISLIAAACIGLSAMAAGVNAQAVIVKDRTYVGTEAIVYGAKNGTAQFITDASGLPVRCMSGCSGSGGLTDTQLRASPLPLPSGAATAARQALPGTAGTPSTEVLSVQGVSGGQPVPIAGGTANTVLSAANPLPVALYIGGGTTPLSVSGTNTDTTSTSGTSARPEVNAVVRIINASGSLSRQYQIDATTASGLGVSAVATAGSSFSNITSATTTTVKSGGGIVQSIVVNTPAAGTITGYCNTAASGTKFATITTIASTQPFTLAYNTYCTTGITIVTSAVMDITVNYR